MARSTDGGASFTNFQVSENPFTPSSNNYLGHYIGISAHNNVVRPVWTRVDNNFPSLWTAIIDSVTTVDEKTNTIVPSEYKLFQNYPNPFNPKTIIQYSIPEKSLVSIKIFNALGKEVFTLVNEEKSSGNYEVEYDGSGLTSGIYYYQLISGNFKKTNKMILLK